MTTANNPNFTPEKYTNIASNHLVVYSIYFLYKDGDEIRAEDIISACFTLFPKKFCLRTYPQWPDSALVGRRLHDCERSGWITARIDSGFKLTAKGNRLAEKVAEELGAEIRRKESPRRLEKAKVKRLQTGKLKKSKSEEKIKDSIAKTPKPVEKIKEQAVKPAPVKPKVEKAKEKQIEAVKPAPVKPKVEKAKEKPIEALKPAPVKPKVEKAKEKPIEALKPAPVKPKVEKAKEKQIEAVKPAPVKPKVEKAKERQIEAVKPAPVKPKVEKVKEKPIEAVKPAPVKPKVEKVKEKPIEAVKPAPVKPKVEKAKERQIEAVKPAPVKTIPKVKPEPIEKPGAKAAQPIVQRPLPVVPTPSAEEKAKAGKFIKMMEASDAYRLYKKNGANANIGEFDFRSLLLCTMESSHETLARNVELFKGYAEIHNRQDLVAFLAVCREKFAHLLAPEKKAVRKLR